MNRPHDVEARLRVADGRDAGDCVDLLQSVVHSEAGVGSVTLDRPAGRLILRYDPRLLSPSQVQILVRRLGLEVDEHFEKCAMRLQGMRCADCLLGLQNTLTQIPGVARVVVNPAAETIAIEYDPAATNLQTFEERITRTGYRVQPPPRSRADLRAIHERETAARRKMAALTALCGAALVAAWLGGKHQWLEPSPVVCLYVVAYVAGAFYSARRAFRELRARLVSVDLLMVIAALGAASVGEWPEGAVLLFLFSLSNTLEQYVLGRTRRAIEALMDLTPEEATVRRDGLEAKVPVDQLKLSDLVIVRPAERIPADGVIVAGSTHVDQSAMTGESISVAREVGDSVFAGTLNQEGAVELRVTRVAGDTTLAKIVRLVEEAQSEKAESQRFTDWFGARYTIGVLGFAALTILVPVVFLSQPFHHSFYRAMTVLVVASPCAVVISIPAAILSAITSAARGGVLFKGGAHLERAAAITAIAFDKTGTLTVGRPQVVDLVAVDGVSTDEVLRLAAAAESRSEHPLAKAIIEAAQMRGMQIEAATSLEALVGRGIRAQVSGRCVLVGKPALFAEFDGMIPANLSAAADRLAVDGKTTVFVGDESGVLGVLAIADTLRPSAPGAIKDLRELGVKRLTMLTGDNRAVAQNIAQRLGMDFEAELLPEDKLRAIRRLREQHEVVAMVGDGINDAPSLAAANLGISLGGAGTDVALETADIVLMADDLRRLPYAIALAREANRIIRQNLIFAFAVMTILLVATFFSTLRLPFAVVGHEGSTVLVIFNGLRLLAFSRPDRR